MSKQSFHRISALARKAIEIRDGIDGKVRAAIGVILGVTLLVGAVAVLASQRSVVLDAFDSIKDASPWLIAAVFVMPLVSWLATSATFSLLSQRYARVPWQDMTALIGTAWLLNALPLRPGMVGRLAFHKKYHHMPITASIRVMLLAMVLSLVALVLLFVAAILVLQIASQTVQIVVLLIPTVAIGVAAMGAKFMGMTYWREVAALFFKSIDMLSWVVRYALVFSLVGQSLSVEHIVLIACVGQIAMLVPITGNGLGLREWVVGLTLAAAAQPGMREQATAIGLTADLVNRAAETLLSVPVGIVSSAFVARAARRYSKAKPAFSKT